jgi:hypothetical protein
MANATIWGFVNADGSIRTGEGFSVEHDSTNAKGVYYIMFNKAFNEAPAVNVTIQCDEYTTGYWVNALILELTASRFEIVMVTDTFTTKYDANFTFTAVGNADD